LKLQRDKTLARRGALPLRQAFLGHFEEPGDPHHCRRIVVAKLRDLRLRVVRLTCG